MNLDELIDLLPPYAKDLKLNYSSLVRQQSELTEQQAWGTVAASAMAAGNDELAKAALGEAAVHLSPEALEAAKSAAAVMGMNNVYYRFLHLSSNEKYKTMPARLRMNAIRTHGVDHADFELWCTAVSAINGCGACVDSHEKTLRDKGVAEEKILAAVRIASVVHAIASVLQTESALGNLFAVPVETA
jgi:lipoyl-dependent peroxiredoxin subunit D